jgi:hypothetical protein
MESACQHAYSHRRERVSVSIEIQGLNKRQRAIADVLWMMNTKADALRFIASLEPQTRRDAETVIEMMQLAVIDECDSVDDLVKLEIDRIKNI